MNPARRRIRHARRVRSPDRELHRPGWCRFRRDVRREEISPSSGRLCARENKKRAWRRSLPGRAVEKGIWLCRLGKKLARKRCRCRALRQTPARQSATRRRGWRAPSAFSWRDCDGCSRSRPWRHPPKCRRRARVHPASSGSWFGRGR